MEQTFKIPEFSAEPCIAEWRAMLKIFHAINHTDKDAKQKYEALKVAASNSMVLTGRQKEGIAGRCDHQLTVMSNPDKYEWKAPNVHKQINGIKP